MKQFTNLLSQHRLFGIDTNILIYAFEQHELYHDYSLQLLTQASEDKIQLVTSAISLSELLVKPFQLQRGDAIKHYKNVVDNFPNLMAIPVHQEVATMAARLRAKYAIHLLDAFQIAAALYVQADAFITNDTKLKKIDDIEVVLLSEYV